MVTQDEAIQLAKDFLKSSHGLELRCYGAVYMSADSILERFERLKRTRPGSESVAPPTAISHWGVSFEFLDSDGGVIDGPLSVIVDAESGKASLEEGS